MDFNDIITIAIPDELKNLSLPCAEEVIFWKNFKNRTFYVDFEIDSDDGTADKLLLITKAILQMNFEEKDIPVEDLKPIYIYVNSYGGDLDVSNNLADVILASRIPVITIALGAAMSAGFIIFLSGTKRYCFKHSQLLAYQGSAGFQGTAAEIAAAQKNYDKTLKKMKEYILSRTSIPEKVFNKNKSKDWYFTEDEIKDYEIATVVSSLGEIIQ